VAEMTDREFLSAILGRMNEIGADVSAIKDRVEQIDRRLDRMENRMESMEGRMGKVEETLLDVKQLQTQQGEQIAGIAVTMMEHTASIRTLKLIK
jgi:chromosome segregation ATPase